MNSDFIYFLIALMFVFTHAFTVRFFLSQIDTLQKKIRKLSNEVAVSSNTTSQAPKFNPRFMEGDLDLTFKGQKASVRAIFYPRNIN